MALCTRGEEAVQLGGGEILSLINARSFVRCSKNSDDKRCGSWSLLMLACVWGFSCR